MRYIKINPKAVLTLRDKIRVTQQELAARVGCSLSAVQFWEAGRSSPRGYRLRRLLELCPDEESRDLFFAPPTEEPAQSSEPPKDKPTARAGLEKRLLDPNFLPSLPAETRKLYTETVENILQLSAMRVEGNQVAAEGLHSLAEAIIQMTEMAKDQDSAQGGHGEVPPAVPQPNERDK
jgi:transcriptional regulator with XRE-family HTH domain